jgi:acyl-CoA thioesterase
VTSRFGASVGSLVVTAPALTERSTTEIELTDSWAYGRGVLHGGWLLETITTAALEHTGHPHPLAVSAHYVAGPRVGPATLEVEPLREGRTVGSLRARLSQDGKPKVEVTITAGTLPAAGTTPFLLDTAPPSMPPPEQCPRQVQPEGVPRNGITENLDVRLDPATASWVRGSFGGSPEVAGWIRSDAGHPMDPLFLLTVADALPPVTLDLGIPGWVPTVELTVHLRCQPVEGWLRVVQRARLVQGGWLDEECEVWDSSGQLVAQARQLAGYREPSA